MPYLLDSNVFITATRLHYDLDVFPGFWAWLIEANKRNIVYSNVAVYDELKDKGDGLADWVKKDGAALFLQHHPDFAVTMRAVSGWVAALPDMTQAGKDHFLAKADPRIIADAMASGWTVVTYEEPAPLSKTKVKIPDVCRAHRIPCLLPWELLRAEQPRFQHIP